MKKPLLFVVASLLFVSPLATHAAGPQNPVQQLLSKLAWRSIGPYIGGRVVAVAGVPSNPNLFYMGGVQGGVWRSTDYGLSWTNISDGKIPGTAQTIGAIAVAESNPNVIYAGSGEDDIRQDVDTGDGIFKTTDAGKTWHYAGLRETRSTMALVIHPKNPDIVYAASMGHIFKPNPERGVFKTTDGGQTWRKVLFVDSNTGAVDVVMDPRNPQILYAAMWQAQRVPGKLTSGGPGSGLYKTTDGGAHWTNLSRNPGFARGVLGKIGVAVAASDPRVVYAIVQASQGGIFRSTDGGATWRQTNSQMKLRQRAFYYTAIFADPTNAKVAFVPQVDGVFKTTDAGVTWKAIMPPGDHHIIWINRRNPKILLEGDDGGATVSTDGGATWSTENNQPTGQFYHVALDDQFPFHVYGAQQDDGAFEGPSASAKGFIALGDWFALTAGESTYLAPQPGNPNVSYGGAYYSVLFRQDMATDDVHNVSPYPLYLSGSPASEQRYRFGWTHPILFSPANPKELLLAGQVVFSSTDSGNTWSVISPDLTRNDPSTEGNSGGPVDFDQTGAEIFPDIQSLAAFPLDASVIWAGSADGLVHVTRDHGKNWALVTPPELPQWAQITSIEPSHTSAGTAYLTASRYWYDDYHPYIYETTDYGAHWYAISSGLPADQYAFVVRQDPRQPNLLFAGTRSTVYVSFNGGAQWQPLTLNLPGVQMRDIAIDARQGDVVVATHGRSFWILDNLAFLEQLAAQSRPDATYAQLFAPETAWLSHAYGGGNFSPPDSGANPEYGVTVFFNLPANYNGRTPAMLSFADARGAVIRTFNLHLKEKHPRKVAAIVRDEWDSDAQRADALNKLTAVEPGMNRFQWNMRYAPATEVAGFREPTTDDFSDSVDGPTIVPGTYTVTLQYGDKRLTQTFRVALDPRIHLQPGDLEARLALAQQLHGSLDRLNTTINAALAAKSKLAAAAQMRIDAEVADLVQFGIHSTEGDVLHETKLRDHIAFLANELDRSYSKPTAAEYATAATLQSEATAAITQLQQLGVTARM